MQTVYVKSDGLFVLNIVPRGKGYGHLDYILGLPFVVRIDRQEHLSRVQFEVQKEVLLKLGFDGHGRVVPVKHLQIHDLRKRLFQHETGTEIVVIKRQFHQGFTGTPEDLELVRRPRSYLKLKFSVFLLQSTLFQRRKNYIDCNFVLLFYSAIFWQNLDEV